MPFELVIVSKRFCQLDTHSIWHICVYVYYNNHNLLYPINYYYYVNITNTHEK